MDPTSGGHRESAAGSTEREVRTDASGAPTVDRDRTALVDGSNRDSVPPRGPLAPAARPGT